MIILADHELDPTPPVFVIAWDPTMLSPDQYARLVEALGDTVRAAGGLGIKRVAAQGFSIEIDGDLI